MKNCVPVGITSKPLIMSCNSSSKTQEDLKQIIQVCLGSQIASGVFLVVITLVTALGNGLLLFAIWKDPFKTFRTQNTFFVIGLAVADFLTGITVCPLTAFRDIGLYISVKRRDSSIIPSLQKAGHVAHLISAATMNSSYIILLLFTLSQFIAINFPFKQKVLVTKSRVIVSVILAWVYAVMFAILWASGVAETAFLKMDFHTTGSLLLLTTGYFCLYRAFKSQMKQLQFLKANETLGKQQSIQSRRNRREAIYYRQSFTAYICSLLHPPCNSLFLLAVSLEGSNKALIVKASPCRFVLQ